MKLKWSQESSESCELEGSLFLVHCDGVHSKNRFLIEKYEWTFNNIVFLYFWLKR